MRSSWGSGFAVIKPTTALCPPSASHPGKNSRLACAVGLAMAAIATLDLLGRFAIDTGINLPLAGGAFLLSEACRV
jgi:hypothetical protein